MPLALRTLTALLGLPLVVIGLLWCVLPELAASLLGASLLDGTGRTTQIGDSAAFFLGSGTMLVLGALRNNASWILAGGCLVGLVAPARILAVLLHGGEWTFDALAVEIVTLAAACATAVVIRRTAAEPSA